jgi:hypothetical protein
MQLNANPPCSFNPLLLVQPFALPLSRQHVAAGGFCLKQAG